MLNARIEALERYPGSWGGVEAQELVMLTLVEHRQYLLCPRAMAHDPSVVRQAWCKFIASVNGSPTSLPLFCVLRDADQLDQLPRLLGDFARWVVRERPAEADV